MKNFIYIAFISVFVIGCAGFRAEYVEVAKVSDCETIAKEKGLTYQTELLYNKHLHYISDYEPDFVCIASDNAFLGKEQDVCYSKKISHDTFKTECYKDKPLYKYVRYYKKITR